MDGPRFDQLTRALTSFGSRRQVITSLTGLALGLVGLRSVDARVCSRAETICREHANCCSRSCGLKDRSGRRRCTCGSATDCPTPNRPCQIATCDAGVCGVTTVTDGTECVGGVCLNGTCSSCTETEGICAANDDCCSGICQKNRCVATVAGTCTVGSGTCGRGQCGCVTDSDGAIICAEFGACGDSISSQADCEEGTYFVSPSPFCGGDNGCLRPPCRPDYQSCFIGETRIAMADGTSKPINQVVIGDMVFGREGVNRVVEIERPRLGNRRLYALNDGPFFVTAEHPFLTEDGWKAIDPAATAAENPALVVGRLAVGDRLRALVGAAVPVVAGGGVCEESPQPDLETVALGSLIGISADPATPLYNLRLDGDHAYFANELLVHNK